ncbi:MULTISPECIES: RNA repair transcriptional activator RtcR [unclassified Massilia]|uniref:RNA repair transcriptional activator RtcR n=1 Tax=unclassified Massilia TaxID=2609279 RepID=UPI00177F4197|nr:MULTISPECIES: RNA repair transcriptional activator RtcR [unclassified Massilia]MBD8533434.1 sigma 54-interacting transcriptional regulator [Massilia sp. CFBP 13647]MBD8676827.1 sigma 54-interacting transcriptional regulator [Massilia sp. CFBP 13721]
MKKKNTVVIGFVGTNLDNYRGQSRWDKWRPTIALTQQPDLAVARFDLLYNGKVDKLVSEVAADIAAVSPETQVVPHALQITNAWDFEEVYGALFDFAKRYPFDPDNEDYWIHITTGTHVVQICMFLMTEARFFPGRLVQTSPPRSPGAGAVGSYTLIDLDLSRYDQIAQRFSREQAEGVAFLKSGIATRNAQFNAMIDEIERVAIRSRSPMLLMGPTGAGKSFLARRVYELKKTRHQVEGRFVELNCATLHGDGAASTLFGHVKGAFTGAASNRPGLLRSAHKGLLFLDEIGELGADEQAMLLTAIEEKRFLPVGSDEEVHSDFQLIAGTNRDLGQEVAAGRFREDLYARINLWTYALPGLRERVEDIEPNLDYLLAQFGAENGQMVRFNRQARARFMQFARSADALWTGNFRDLWASVTRMATLAQAGRVTEAIVDDEIARLQRLWRPHVGRANEDAVALEDLVGTEAASRIDLFDAVQLQAVITVCRQSKTLSDAGRKLFGVSRDAKAKPNDADRLKKYLARFDLSWDQLFG